MCIIKFIVCVRNYFFESAEVENIVVLIVVCLCMHIR